METYTCEIIKSEIDSTAVYGLIIHNADGSDTVFPDLCTDLKKLLKLSVLLDEFHPPVKIIPELFDDYIFGG